MLEITDRQPFALPPVFTGLALSVAIGGLAFVLHGLPHMQAMSPAILAAVMGIGLAHVIKVPPQADAGIQLSSRTLLRWAVALLGLQVSFQQIMALGLTGFALIATGLVTSFLTIKAMGRLLGVEAGLAELIAAGTSICGASAVAGTNAVTGAKDEDVAYAVAMVTVFGTVSMLVYPLVDYGLHLSAHQYGLWAGASIHEVAQVVGATAQIGPEATQTGAIAKLARILMLAPLVMSLRFSRRKTTEAATGGAMPLFVLGFLGLMVINSVFSLPHELTAVAGQVSGFLLAVALGAMGLKTHIKSLMAKGWPPLILGAIGTVFIAVFTLGLTLIFT
ncbi:MAG: YeiH family protein [Asticcacaulis sp.]